MKKFINILLLTVLVCAAVLYVAKMTYNNSINASVDQRYESTVGKTFDDYRTELEKQRNTLQDNDNANSGLLYKDHSDSSQEYADPTVVNSFYELMPLVVERYNSTKNLEAKTTGSFNASVNAIGITLKNIAATHSITMQKSSNGQKYCDFTISNLSLSDFGFTVADFVNIVHFSGSQYNMRRFGERMSMTASDFAKNYGSEVGVFLYDFNSATIDNNSLQFEYNPQTERYIVSFQLKTGNQGALGAERHAQFHKSMLTSEHMKNFWMCVNTVNMRMVISKDYKIISTDSTENWTGGLVFDKYSFVGNIKIGMDIRLVTSYAYRTGAFRTKTL